MSDRNTPDTENGAAGGAGGELASPRRDRIVSELAGEIRAARADITRLGALIADNADLLAHILPRIVGLDTVVAELGGRVDGLDQTAAAAKGTAGVAAVDWPALTADAAAAEWEALAEWAATVLGPFYEITRAQLPDCWALHPPAVIELVWLRRTYNAAHAPDAAATAAAEWHTRWRRDALANIATLIPKRWCRPGEHYVHEHDRPHHTPTDYPPPEPYWHTPGHRPDPADLRVGAEGEITQPRYWEAGYRAAADADMAWRRARDAAARDTGDPPPG
jgi:hypothetical protein